MYRFVRHLLHVISLVFFFPYCKCVKIRNRSYLWKSRIRGIKGNCIIVGENSKLLGCNFRIKGHGNSIIIGDNVYIKNLTINILAGNNNTIKLSNGCFLTNNVVFIDSSSHYNEITLDEHVRATGQNFWIENDYNRIFVGQFSTFEEGGQLAACEGKSIIIGNDCMFSHGILMRTSDSHGLYQEGRRYNFAKDILIGNHCWIGLQCLILKGTTLPDGCIVAARSLVTTGVFEKNSIVGGTPARTMRKRIEWSRTRTNTLTTN